MRLRHFIICLFSFLLIAACGKQGKEVQKTAKTAIKKREAVNLDELYQWMQGSFDSYEQSAGDSAYYTVTLEMHPVWTAQKGGKWLYVEQAMANQKFKPYRQRMYRLSKKDEYTIISEVYTLPNPTDYTGQWNNQEVFRRMVPDDLTLRDGCAITLSKRDGKYVGSTKDKNCESSLKGAAYATSEVVITKNGIESWDRGFDTKDKQVWGAEKGAYRFNKIVSPKLTYPESKRGTIVDDYHGTKVADPYRWLEDENSSETHQWIETQNKLTEDYIKALPYRKAIRKRLQSLWNYPRQSMPFEEDGYVYYYKSDGLQNHAVLYRKKGWNGKEEMFLDPNTFSKDGSHALGFINFSRNGKYAVYSVSKSGSDWREFFVMNAKTGKLMDDHIKNIKFSGASWYKDGFFYNKYDAPEEGKKFSAQNNHSKIYYHKIGTGPDKDELVYEDKSNPHQGYSISLTHDEEYMLLYGWKGSAQGGSLKYAKAKNWKKGTFKPVIDDYESNNGVIHTTKDAFYILTNRNAPKKKLVKVNLKKPQEENWEEIIPEGDYVLESVKMINDGFVVKYMKDVSSRLYIYDLKGNRLKEIKLPGIGIVNGINTRNKRGTIFYDFESYMHPKTIYSYHIDSDLNEVYHQPDINFNFEDYETKQVFYASKDGTKIPMFITHKKGIELNGQNPVMLYGYGGFNISRIPEFKLENLPFYEAGGVYATANLRGGSEYGEEWHKAGMLEKKQNVYDDFIAAAEYLIREGYTNINKLAITGRSNGGLLIGAVVNQRPELFKVAIPVVGVMDMLRYQKFTIGWAWTGEFGSSDEPEQFKFIYPYSPYHNIKKTKYPATLVLTAERDDRVVPAHSYKYTANLQHHQQGDLPILIKVERKAGHGSGGRGKTPQQIMDDWADRWTFVFHHLGMYPLM